MGPVDVYIDEIKWRFERGNISYTTYDMLTVKYQASLWFWDLSFSTEALSDNPYFAP